MGLVSDLRLVSVWHGSDGVREIHFSLYNNGITPVGNFHLCMTGTLWLTDPAEIVGGTIVQTVSNFIAVKGNNDELAAGGVWTFTLSGLNEWPRHAGDGTKSAYVELADGTRVDVAVQPLTRSHASSTESASTSRDVRPPRLSHDRLAMSLSVIPFPNVASVAISPLPEGHAYIALTDDADAATQELCARIGALAQRVTGHGQAIFAAAEDAPGAFRRLLLAKAKDPRLGIDGYKLTFDGSLIQMEAQSEAGFTYGLITLAHMMVGARSEAGQFGFPVRGTITDVPRFGWRGLELDVARTFYPADEIKSIVDLLAWLKLNILHLHLTDDEAWRIDVDGYPEIAGIAAWRGSDLPLPPLLGSGEARYGGYYDRGVIKDIEAHAGALGITIVPEVDIPGHAHAVLTALPDLREPGDGGGYHSIQGFHGNALNPCLPQTYRFLNAVFATITSQFGGAFVHIGGDEIAAETWSQSPAAITAAKQAGLVRTRDLQGLVLEHAHNALRQAGRRTVVWEDALWNAHLDPDSTTAVVWQHPERAHELARRGFDVVLAPGNAYYLDMAASAEWDAPGGHWAGVVPLERTYDFEPGLGWPAELLGHLKGIQACIWGEHMIDRRQFDALVFPRIYAFAERAWIDRTTKDFEGLVNRIQYSMARIDRLTESVR